jgi:uncharacterized protein (DUF302 family)
MVDRPSAARRELQASFDEAAARLPEALASEGFGVLTQIDVQDTFRKKLGVEFRRYRIFGACNPALAHEALRTDLDVGVFLPCNVVLYEDDAGRTIALAIDPTSTVAATGDARLADIAGRVKEKLTKAVWRLE